LKLARSVERVIAARGKKAVVFDMTNDPPDDETLATHLLGPSGNLKAPTLRLGDTLLVGFGEEAYRQVFGDR
jgi:ABC-type arginine transport system ATPase subunit